MTVTTNLRNTVVDLIDDVIIESQRELTLKECCLSPFVFLQFCKVFLAAYTKDWQRPYRGTSIYISFLTYGLIFSLFSSAIFMAIAIVGIGQPYQAVTLFLGLMVGVLAGYVFAIQKEREAANKKIRKIQGIEKLEKWKTLGLLEIYHQPRKN